MKIILSKVILIMLVSAFILAFSNQTTFATSYSITGLTPEGIKSSAFAINDGGQVIGAFDQGVYLYDNGNFTDLTALYNFGPDHSSGMDINNRGQIVNTGSNGNVELLSDGVVTNLGKLGSLSPVEGINDSGQIVGWYLDSDGYTRAFAYDAGSMVDLGLGRQSVARGINNEGTIVGFESSGAYIYNNGIVTNLGAGAASDINNHGDVVGNYPTPDGTHAFLYSNGEITDLGALSDGGSWPWALNEREQVVGASDVIVGTEIWCDYDGNCIEYPIYSWHAFVYYQGLMTDLNDLIPLNTGWELICAHDINERGQIVGLGHYNGENRGFLLTPVPEPATMLLLGSGLIGLAGLGRKKLFKRG